MDFNDNYQLPNNNKELSEEAKKLLEEVCNAPALRLEDWKQKKSKPIVIEMKTNKGVYDDRYKGRDTIYD